MNDFEMNIDNDLDLSSDHYYLIKHLTLITGLTDRTIRNYLTMGILQGEKSQRSVAFYSGTGRRISSSPCRTPQHPGQAQCPDL